MPLSSLPRFECLVHEQSWSVFHKACCSHVNLCKALLAHHQPLSAAKSHARIGESVLFMTPPKLGCLIFAAAGTLQAGSAYARLHLKGGRTIQAKLVVGSDGGSSKVRQMAQLRTVSWSYKQRGLVATVATDTPNNSALQVFLPNGPLALLPVRDGFSNIVWSTTPAQAADLEAMTPASFVQAVNMVSPCMRACPCWVLGLAGT